MVPAYITVTRPQEPFYFALPIHMIAAAITAFPFSGKWDALAFIGKTCFCENSALKAPFFKTGFAHINFHLGIRQWPPCFINQTFYQRVGTHDATVFDAF